MGIHLQHWNLDKGLSRLAGDLHRQRVVGSWGLGPHLPWNARNCSLKVGGRTRAEEWFWAWILLLQTNPQYCMRDNITKGSESSSSSDTGMSKLSSSSTQRNSLTGTRRWGLRYSNISDERAQWPLASICQFAIKIPPSSLAKGRVDSKTPSEAHRSKDLDTTVNLLHTVVISERSSWESANQQSPGNS